MRIKIQDLLLVLGFAAPLLLFLSYWGAEGFRMPLSQRYSLYVLQDPTLPAAVSLSLGAAAFASVSSREKAERHQEYFDQAARWFFLPVYLAVVFSVLLWYRYDFSSPFPAEGIFVTIGRTAPGALAILIPTFLILSLGLLSLSPEQRASVFHSLVIVLGALLIFGGAFVQLLLTWSSSGRLKLGYAAGAASAYAVMILGGFILFYSLRRFIRPQSDASAQAEQKG